jgi:hypothetical protein
MIDRKVAVSKMLDDLESNVTAAGNDFYTIFTGVRQAKYPHER